MYIFVASLSKHNIVQLISANHQSTDLGVYNVQDCEKIHQDKQPCLVLLKRLHVDSRCILIAPPDIFKRQGMKKICGNEKTTKVWPRALAVKCTLTKEIIVR